MENVNLYVIDMDNLQVFLVTSLLAIIWKAGTFIMNDLR